MTVLKSTLATVAGGATLVVYALGVAVSLAFFPGRFRITQSYLSDLGNATLNPRGALAYDVGIAVAGACLFPFFFGLRVWRTDVTWRNRVLGATRAIGAFEGATLILIGAHPTGAAHVTWSNAQFFSNLLVLGLGTTALFGHPRFVKAIGYFAIVAIVLQAAALVLILLGRSSPLVEWLTVITTLVFVALVALISKDNSAAAR